VTLKEELSALIADQPGNYFRLPTFPDDPSYVYPGGAVKYEMTLRAARLVVFLMNNVEAIRDTLP
jgi:hypothetical protein